MNLLLIRSDELDEGGCATLDGRRARHLLDVLKCQPGQRVKMGVLDGARGQGEVLATMGDRVTLRWIPGEPPPVPDVDLLLAMPRPKVMKRLWAQLAALGVGKIVITAAAKVEKTYFETHWLDPENYRPLLIEGLEQAGDTRLPEVIVRRRFRPLVEDELDALFPETARLVAHPGDGLAEAAPRPGRRTVVAVGPEGGWSEFELRLLRERGFQPIGLGPRTLRTDTACVALLAVVQRGLR